MYKTLFLITLILSFSPLKLLAQSGEAESSTYADYGLYKKTGKLGLQQKKYDFGSSQASSYSDF